MFWSNWFRKKETSFDQFRDLPEMTFPDSEIISLGQNCSAAFYLKLIGRKTASYPFDWILSSPEIVEHCLSDGFEAFLDKSFLEPFGEGKSGHRLYHANMFFHRDLTVPENHAYYQRTAERFKRVFDSDKPITFVMTALPEHAKRPSWSNGFVHEFEGPLNQDIPSEMHGLVEKLRERQAKTRLIVFRQYTDTGRYEPICTFIEEDLAVFDIHSIAGSDGAKYMNTNDHEAHIAFLKALFPN